jgi:hypothetical protein
MAERSGISGLPNFINLVMIVGILSAATADVYFTVGPLIRPLTHQSRCLETLASEGLTWRFLGLKPLELAGQMASPEQQNKGLIHVTWPRLIAVLFACVPGLLALMSLGSGSDTVCPFLFSLIAVFPIPDCGCHNCCNHPMDRHLRHLLLFQERSQKMEQI